VAVCLAVAIVTPERRQFEEFKAKFNKKYDHKEEDLRFELFTANLNKIKKMNKDAGDTIYGVTKFSDLSASEFKNTYLNYRAGTSVKKFNSPKRMANLSGYSATPATFDWRDHGAVTPVKNQGQCGSCWAFSAVEATESAWFLANHTLIELSPQQVVSCDDVDQGCNGGDTPTAYAYIIKAGGLELNSIYPYKSGIVEITVFVISRKLMLLQQLLHGIM
jgi:C1A family cysteine protease